MTEEYFSDQADYTQHTNAG